MLMRSGGAFSAGAAQVVMAGPESHTSRWTCWPDSVAEACASSSPSRPRRHPEDSGALQLSTSSAYRSEEVPQVLDEQSGLLHRGEVAPAGHDGPVRHVVKSLDPGAGEAQHLLLRVARNARRDSDEVRRLLPQAAVLALPVETRRGGDRLRHPVQHHVRDQMVARVAVLRVAAAVAPGAKLLNDPGEEPGRRVIECHSQRLGL